MCQEEHAALLGEAARRISEQWKSEVEVGPVPRICRPKSNFLSVNRLSDVAEFSEIGKRKLNFRSSKKV